MLTTQPCIHELLGGISYTHTCAWLRSRPTAKASIRIVIIVENQHANVGSFAVAIVMCFFFTIFSMAVHATIFLLRSTHHDHCDKIISVIVDLLGIQELWMEI